MPKKHRSGPERFYRHDWQKRSIYLDKPKNGLSNTEPHSHRALQVLEWYIQSIGRRNDTEMFRFLVAQKIMAVEKISYYIMFNNGRLGLRRSIPA